jgi:hypothetical protein
MLQMGCAFDSLLLAHIAMKLDEASASSTRFTIVVLMFFFPTAIAFKLNRLL